MAELLIIDDDRSIRRSLELHFQGAGHSVHQAGTIAEGLNIWRMKKPDIVLLDLLLPDGDGIELLQQTEDEKLSGMVILITAHHDLDKAITAMRAGAFDYVNKPINVDELEVSIDRALSLQKEHARLALIADLVAERKPGKIVGESRQMLELHKQIGLASRGRANVLIRGESGTGKELVARSIHRNSTPGAPMIPVNCSAIVPTLLESELFGHERGAFTGAVDRKLGLLEVAGEGTLFLDEIADMDVSLQAKLLRVLQEREFQRVGGSSGISFLARVIAATNRDLELMIKEGTFREDLYYRLKVVEIYLPPLRERRKDIPPLVDHLLARINRELKRSVTGVPNEVMEALVKYDWHGNIRELENILTAGVMRSTGDTLQILYPEQKGQQRSVSQDSGADESGWERTLADVERDHISRVLTEVKGRLGRACEILGISRPTLRKKCSEYGLK